MSEEFKIDPSIAYDVVELPSRGVVYPNNKKSVRVAYLTAADENILASPNIAASGGIVNELLKRKVLDKDILVEDIVEEDKQAILIFLRNTSFGSEYTLSLTDPKTKEKFTATVDLSTLKMKDFNLIADGNGEYPYFLNKSKIDITFKYLTQKQEDEIRKIEESWNGTGAAPIMTKRLEMMIKSLGGNRDVMQIHNFIENKMPITDSQDFRKYATENKPGVNLTQKVTTPSGEEIQVTIGFGVEFFRPFYGV
jgi:hypothetical protein